MARGRIQSRYVSSIGTMMHAYRVAGGCATSAQGLDHVKKQRRAKCREKYFFGSPRWERRSITELCPRRICEADSLSFARVRVFKRPGSHGDIPGVRPRVRPYPRKQTSRI